MADGGQPQATATPAIAFIGSIEPEKVPPYSLAFSTAGHVFQHDMLRSLREASGCPFEIISYRPLPMFPRAPELLVTGRRATTYHQLELSQVPFLNIPVLKQLTLSLSLTGAMLRWLWRRRAQPRFAIVFNVYLPHSFAVLLATRLLGGKAVAFVADLPHNLNSQNHGWRRLLHRLNFLLESRSLKHFAALITVTGYAAQDYAPRLPALVMEGAVDSSYHTEAEVKASWADRSASPARICMYSGSLHDISGIEFLLDAFRHIQAPEYRLWIFGKGSRARLATEAARQDQRITYWGYLPHTQVLQYQRQATVLINPRPTGHWITRYTFPYKLLEYMLSGRPVINTDLQGVPAEYHQYTLVLNDETPAGLARLIEAVCARSADDLAAFGQRARQFVVQEKNWRRQGQRIYDFLCSLPG